MYSPGTYSKCTRGRREGLTWPGPDLALPATDVCIDITWYRHPNKDNQGWAGFQWGGGGSIQPPG